MYQEERLRKITEWLEEDNVLSNQDLMERLDISRDTARRDIIKLVEAGNAVRTHGGIANRNFSVQVENYKARMVENIEGKKRIGKAAAKEFSEGSLCFLDTSTHMEYLCANLNRKVNAYTHSLDNLEYLTASSKAEIHCLGGTLNRENRFFYGCEVLEALAGICFDIAVLGVAAMSEDGIYYEDQEDAKIKGFAARRSKRTIVMADYPKFQRASKFQALNLSEIDLLVTDRELTKQWKAILEKENVKWMVV